MGRTLDRFGMLSAVTAMVALGGAIAVTPLLLHYPVYAGQALRYGVAAVFLAGLARARGRGPVRLSAGEWLGLAALSLTGLVGFNVALVEGLRTLDPATMGTVVGASPIVLATLGPIVEGRRPSYRLVAAAAVVVAGSALTYGAGPASGRGLVFAVLALAGESAFSLVAVPLLPRLGPVLLSAGISGLASAVLAVAAIVAHPSAPFPLPTPRQAAALTYLALVVTAFATLAWYTGVQRLGPARAGLLVALVPIVSALASLAVGTGRLGVSQAAGALLVAAGLLVAGRRRDSERRTPSGEGTTPCAIARAASPRRGPTESRPQCCTPPTQSTPTPASLRSRSTSCAV